MRHKLIEVWLIRGPYDVIIGITCANKIKCTFIISDNEAVASAHASVHACHSLLVYFSCHTFITLDSFCFCHKETRFEMLVLPSLI